MKRRDFIKLGALLATYSLLWACTDEEGPAKTEHILIVGAGIAGLAAGRELQSKGYKVTIFEGRDRIGGRIFTDRTWPNANLDMGASWIHGIEDNPITELAETFNIDTLPTDYDSLALYNTDGRPVNDDEAERISESFAELTEYIAGNAEELDDDISLQQAVDYALEDETLDTQTQRELNYLLNTTLEHEYAADVSDLSLFYFNEGEDFGGEDVIFPGGYDQIVQELAKGLEIKLNQIVESINYTDQGVTITTNQSQFTADRAVITLPLGVLKKGNIAFSPPLPAEKTSAINQLGMGLLNKVYLRFADVFWDEEPHLLGYISAQKGEWAEWLNIYRYTGQPVLLAFNAADYGRAIEGLSDAEIIAGAMATLRQIYGADIPNPTATLITRWASDPFAYGSYSYMPVGVTPKARKALAQPLNNRLFFAGEATSQDYPATVHGAFLSGLREAERIKAL